jgi:oligopeptide transport system ATP-binding protein
VATRPDQEERAESAAAGRFALEVEGLRKVYHVGNAGRRGRTEVVAVDDVAFTIAPGSSLAIVGESGSGKTTTARMVMGLERPTAGRISLGGVERGRGRLRSRERRRYGREIQIVFQDPFSSLDPRQRVGDAVEEVLKLHFNLSSADRSARVTELFGQVGLDEQHRRALPRALSGGQQQRVAIARALASMPKVLILDEAVASLDVSIQAQVLNLLADIREETGVTYLFISHDLAVVRQVSDDIIVMHRGRIVERGATAMVLDQPQDPYTRKLLSAVPRRGWKPVRHKMAAD